MSDVLVCREGKDPERFKDAYFHIEGGIVQIRQQIHPEQPAAWSTTLAFVLKPDMEVRYSSD